MVSPSTLVTPFPISHGTSALNLVHTPIIYGTPSLIRPLAFGWLHAVIKLFFLLVFIRGETHVFFCWEILTCLYIVYYTEIGENCKMKYTSWQILQKAFHLSVSYFPLDMVITPIRPDTPHQIWYPYQTWYTPFPSDLVSLWT